MDDDTLRTFWQRCKLGFCRSMFSADLGHRKAEEVLARTWREFGAFAAEALRDESGDATARAAAELDLKLAEALGAEAAIEENGDGRAVSRWETCPLWEEMKQQRLEKAFICVGACDRMSAELAKAVGEDVTFERGNEMPRGGPCEKIWRTVS
ncbi:MAG: hypothetical protein ACE5JM_07985 [Armatimonadota bacterium]